jgi:replicative DNA helicase
MSKLHSADLQLGYLGAVLMDSRILEAYPVALDDFGGGTDQALLGAMMALHSRGEPVSTDGVMVELHRHGRAVDIDRVLSLATRADRDAGACARRIRQLARMRRMQAAAMEALAALEAADDDGEAVARRAMARGAEVGEVAEDERITFEELQFRGTQAIIALARDMREDGMGLRLGTPSVDLDYRPAPGHLVIVGGRPNVGKTSLTFAWHLDCARRGIPSDIVSVDDDVAEYGGRAVYATSGVDPGRLLEGERLSSADVQRMVCKAAEERGLPIGFTKVRSMTIEGVIGAITRAVRVHGARWVSVDYLTKIRGGAGRDPRERTNDVLSQLEACAMQLGIPVVLLVQLKRGEGGDDFKEPNLASFKETGEIEERAKGAVLIWRKSDKPGEPVQAKNAKVKGKAAGRRFWMMRHPDSGLLVEVDEQRAKRESESLRGADDDEQMW